MVISPERLPGWLDRFAQRHGEVSPAADADGMVLTAADGAVATILVPFGPLVGDLVEHVQAERRVGVLLVRLGGHAAGIFEGARLVSSKVGSRQVHGRSAAGGQSQQRFARRREGQVRVALQAAADNAMRILVPEAATFDAVVLGGDRTAVTAVMTDRRLGALVPLLQPHVIDVPDPRLKVLQATPELFRGVRIKVVEESTK